MKKGKSLILEASGDRRSGELEEKMVKEQMTPRNKGMMTSGKMNTATRNNGWKNEHSQQKLKLIENRYMAHIQVESRIPIRGRKIKGVRTHTHIQDLPIKSNHTPYDCSSQPNKSASRK